MRISKRKLIFTYLCLVGIPLVALLAILRGGQRLTPPIAVGGAWNLEADWSALTSAACRDLVSSVKQPFLSISQSGPVLAFTLNNSERTSLPGTIQNSTLTMGAEGTVAGSCADPKAIRLKAAVNEQGRERALTGALSILGCAECAPVPFRAFRQNPSARAPH